MDTVDAPTILFRSFSHEPQGRDQLALSAEADFDRR